ncbi:MAG: preprotein translocase subunit SecY [Breznakia sp.]
MMTTFVRFFQNKEIRKKILFTLAMFFVYSIGSSIPVPNTAPNITTGSNDLLTMMQLLGGGALDQLSIFSLGIGPYITASIIIQLLSMDVIPHFTELSKSGQTGRKVLDKYTRYLGLILCFVQSYTTVMMLNSESQEILLNDSLSGFLYVTVVFTAGTMFLLWIADRISMHGIGNGVSMIIFAGIVSKLPYQFSSAFSVLTTGLKGSALFSGLLTFAGFVAIYLLIIVLVVFTNTAIRKIPIQYTSSTVQKNSREMNYLPLKINSASVIPVIFASSVMMAPLQIARLLVQNNWIEANGVTNAMENWMGLQSLPSVIIYGILTFLFTFFYTRLTVDPEKISDNLSKSGTYIPGVRPGKETKDYINKVLSRITVLGATVLVFIALMPHIAPMVIPNLPTTIRFGGTGMIIVVGVALETVSQLKGQLTTKSYKGFLGIGK